MSAKHASASAQRAPRLRLLADDLTGALDTAAQFTGLLGPVTVRFHDGDAGAADPALAYDAATRGLDPEDARERLASLARFLPAAPLAFLKLDSLLRGHAAESVAGAFATGAFRSAIVAPAFPAQGRAMRGGVQHARELEGGWSPVAPGFADELAAAGLPLRRAADAGEIAGEGVFLCDAESDVDLRAVAAAGARLAPPVLWCGAAGLAAALAGSRPPRKPVPAEPLLAVVGSNHPVTRAQIERFDDVHPELWMAVREGGAEFEEVRDCLAERGAALVTFALPDYLFAPEASRRIAGIVGELLVRLDAPAGLFVSGGETLRAVAGALGARAFETAGEVAPGLPSSRIAGGRWDGVRVISKSGAFGDADLLVRLIEGRGASL